MLITGFRLAEAHALIRLTGVELEFRVGQSINPIRAIEASKTKAFARRSANVHPTQLGLEAVGLDLINYGQSGVRLLRAADHLNRTRPIIDLVEGKQTAIESNRVRS